jgi:oligoribonuclease
MEPIARTLQNLIWIDLEFTDLDPGQGQIMQAAMIVTRADLTPIPPPGIEAEVGGLQFDVSMTQEQADSASDWVKANQAKHLAASLAPDALSVANVEEFFVAYLLTCCEIPDSVPKRPLLAGNSVHADRSYLQRFMPNLTALLSYRNLDVSTLKEIAARWAPDLEFNKNPESIRKWYPADVQVKGAVHDALFDIKGSISELSFYRGRLFAEIARS